MIEELLKEFEDNIHSRIWGSCLNYFTLIKEYDGVICKTCGIKQGINYHGFKKYYCDHISDKVNRRLSKNGDNKELINSLLYSLKLRIKIIKKELSK